jgi:DNA mismatch repair protein MSH6
LFKSLSLDPGDLIPRAEKDEAYDEVMETIDGLESELDKELKKLEKKHGSVVDPIQTCEAHSNT